MGDSGDPQQKGEQVRAMTDNSGSLSSPGPQASVHETAMIRLPKGLNALKHVAKTVGLDRRGADLHLDAGVDATHPRPCLFNAGMIPHSTAHPRHRTPMKRGRQRWFNAVIQALRTQVDRTVAWAATFKRRLRRFAHLQQRHVGMKLMAYTFIKVREFYGA
jgi:transposase